MVDNFFKIESEGINSVNEFSTNGTLVKSWNSEKDEYSISNLNSGIYIISVNTKNGTITEKIIKK